MMLLSMFAIASASRMNTRKILPEVDVEIVWDAGEVAWDVPEPCSTHEWIKQPLKATPVEKRYNELSVRMMETLSFQAVRAGIAKGLTSELFKMDSATDMNTSFMENFYGDVNGFYVIFLAIASLVGIKFQIHSEKKEKKIERQSSPMQTEQYLRTRKTVMLICITIISIFTKNVKSVT